MGVMAIPFDTVKRAKLFAKCMQKPWMAKVYFNKRDEFYTWKFSPVALVGSDDLFDIFDGKAGKKKDFDIRPYVKKEVRSWLDNDFDPDGANVPLEAVNIVRAAVGLKTINKKSITKKSEPVTHLKSCKHRYRIRGYDIYKISELSSLYKKIFNVEKFANTKDTYYLYEVRFASERKLDEVKNVLKEKFDVVGVRKISPYRVKDRLIIIKLS